MRRFIPPLLVAFFVGVVVNSAWICDDAYISLRTVDNFVHGYGLRWNIGERVQSFTNPLWTLVLSVFYFVTREAYYTTIFVAIGVSALVAFLLIYKVAGKTTRPAMLGLALLVSSKAFIDYSTSGLENPMTHLFIILFFWVHFTSGTGSTKLFLLSLLASMSMVNRMDSVLIYLPSLVHCLYLVRRDSKDRRWIAAGALGFAPFVLWEILSLVYYGFLFPNTAYSKLAVGVSTREFLAQGGFYLLDSLVHDPLTLLAVIAATALVVAHGRGSGVTALLGALGYILYVVIVGGDFMSGRFLAAPFLVAVVLLVHLSTLHFKQRHWRVSFALVLVSIVLSPTNPLRVWRGYENKTIDDRGIADERGWYYKGSGLLVRHDIRDSPDHTTYLWSNRGREFRRESSYRPVRVAETVGLIGYYSGPEVLLIDHVGLGDPLLARLEPDLNSGWRYGLPRKSGWRIGHFYRQLPQGYVQTRLTGKNLIENPVYAKLYDKLALVTQGKLFSAARWAEIWRFNTGANTLARLEEEL